MSIGSIGESTLMLTWSNTRMTAAEANEQEFSILAVDGGGVRGIYAAEILAKIEQTTQRSVRESFDLLAGTSTGSIVTGAAAAGISMEEVVRLFELEAPRIFNKGRVPSGLAMFVKSRYSRDALEEVLADYVPQIQMGQLDTALMITSADIATGGVHVFKSRYLQDLGQPYERDGNVLLRDAILASCAAPTYFDPKSVGAHLLVDGGLWANNPSIIALTEAVAKFKKEVKQVRIFSLGTGHTTAMYPHHSRWGLLTGWERDKLIAFTFGLQSQASTSMARLILEDRYLRLDPTIEGWELDDVARMGNLKALADRDYTFRSEQILEHIHGGGK